MLAPSSAAEERGRAEQDDEHEQEAPGHEQHEHQTGQHVERPLGRALGAAPCLGGRSGRRDGYERKQAEQPEHGGNGVAGALCHATVTA